NFTLDRCRHQSLIDALQFCEVKCSPLQNFFPIHILVRSKLLHVSMASSCWFVVS
ncbi:hypothetical protein BDR04DRAFT_1101104, partial [Suillus decipiens]